VNMCCLVVRTLCNSPYYVLIVKRTGDWSKLISYFNSSNQYYITYMKRIYELNTLK
jgi:hypothetical protein